MKNKILLLTLKTFSATGGIETVCKCLGKALNESVMNNLEDFSIHSLYDNNSDAYGNRYFPLNVFKGFDGHKLTYIFNSIIKAHKKDIVILSHVNLLPLGWMIKKISPKKKLLLIAHGIEVWKPFSYFKTKMLAVVDEFVSVSRFTQKKIEYIHLISSSKSSVINNCIDPYLDDNVPQLKINALKNKFNLSESDKIIFTLTRLSKEDRKKGCENVLKALKKVKEFYENVKYIIGGSVEHDEKNILLVLASSLDLSDSLIFADFIPNEELGAYYLLSDVFILSSNKEGFGIVFAEAMFFGTPVIGGNQDGSVDALCDGELGTLINPSDVSSIEDALINVLKDTENFLPDRNLLLSKFSFEKYKSNWSDLLNKSKNLN